MALSNAPRTPVPAGVPIPPGDGPKASRTFVVTLTLAQFGLFLALLAPVMVTMQLKASQLDPANPASVIGAVLPWGALGAFIANPLFGMLSDRTRSRFGRRRPWILGGVLVFTAALVWVAGAPSVLQLGIAWFVAQVSANAVLACLIAAVADQVPEDRRGTVSSWVGIAQNASVLLAFVVAVEFTFSMWPLFLVPAAIGLVTVLVFVARLEDIPHPEPREPFDLKAFARTFYTSPRENPDFALAWWSRFFIIFGSFMFTTVRVLYLQHSFALDAGGATLVALIGVAVYTVALVVAARLAGWASDRLGRRKVFVALSTVLFAVGLVMLAHVETAGGFYLAEVVMGLAYGVYLAVDTALVIDVLPSPEEAGKDLGVLNMANALPQSLAPAATAALLAVGSATSENYGLMLWVAGVVTVLGAVAIMFVRKVR
ncbi:MFS transporter [Kineococcus sp. SYSU DK018]|uniref:MFS transporter n=1 Tax=Kineococcus sp. SYSU DK018 TaxID=3383139 RepID=UPI003D7E5613